MTCHSHCRLFQPEECHNSAAQLKSRLHSTRHNTDINMRGQICEIVAHCLNRHRLKILGKPDAVVRGHGVGHLFHVLCDLLVFTWAN